MRPLVLLPVPMTLAAFFESPVNRFIVSGSLITLYLAADVAARRSRSAGRAPEFVAPPPPRWLHPLVVVAVCAYYALIGPTGGSLAGGWVNLGGVALTTAAGALRFSRAVRFPALGARGLLYLALPAAVGTPWGWLVLSLPACAASVIVCRCADRAPHALDAAAPVAGADLPRYRLVPGIW